VVVEKIRFTKPEVVAVTSQYDLNYNKLKYVYEPLVSITKAASDNISCMQHTV
jgi:hypothetical protein